MYLGGTNQMTTNHLALAVNRQCLAEKSAECLERLDRTGSLYPLDSDGHPFTVEGCLFRAMSPDEQQEDIARMRRICSNSRFTRALPRLGKVTTPDGFTFHYDSKTRMWVDNFTHDFQDITMTTKQLLSSLRND
mgnify:CR=1 FL=1